MERRLEQYFTPYKSDACTVYLFGSRVWGNPRPASDIDIAIDAGSMHDFFAAEEALLESDCPYNMDIVNLSTLDNGYLKKRIIEHGYKI